MKYFILVITLLSLLSCREEEGVWDKLTQAERDAIEARAETKCLATANDDILDMTTTSNTELLRLTPLDTWKLEYLKGTTLIETSNIYVWKISGSTVYFLIKLIEGGTPSNRFVKFTSTTNTEMYQDLRKKKCDKSLTLTISRTLLTAKIDEAQVTVDTNTYSKTVATHTYQDEFPAFFGFLNKKRVKTIYNDETNVSVSSETFNYVVTRLTDVVSLPSDFTNDTDYPNKSYCVVDYTSGTPNLYPMPNGSEYGLECSSSAAAGPDPDGDAIANFNPATELI